jgi:enoyl-CoA hydratase/carnithine racemase
MTLWESTAQVKAVVIQGSADKAFCAGGDVRRVYECIKEDSSEYTEFFKEEFALDEYIYTYPKPCIALMHGIVMGGGMGLAQGATFRLICENTKIAMPETAIGYFPDVGASYFLTRRSTSLAVYLGVTGKLLSPEDSLFCGLADWVLPLNQWQVFKDRLEAIEFEESSLDGSVFLTEKILSILRDLGARNDFPNSGLQKHMKSITENFSAPSLQEVYAALQANGSDPWCLETLENMKRNSPLAMASALQLLTQGATLSLKQCFAVELELNHLWKTRGEFVEGVRAALVDKDKKPLWKYALSDITTDFLRDTFPPIFAH